MIRDYIYVRDVADGYLQIAEQMHKSEVVGEAFNLSSERPLSVLELTNEILTATGRKDLEPNILNLAKSEIQEQTVSGEKASRILNWTPKHSLADALSETVAWYQAFLDGVDT